MDLKQFIWGGALSLLPISELRGGIPYMMATGVPWYVAYLYCVAMNMLAGPIAYLFLNTFHGLFYRLTWYRNFFDRFVEKARAKVHPYVEKYGTLGLVVFVGVPFPLTGAWTGVLGGWFLGIRKRNVLAAVALGVLISGTIVTLVMVFGIKALSFFVKG